MCLFLTALLRDGRIGLADYGIEIREFCVNYLWVVEAAEVPIRSALSLGGRSANLCSCTSRLPDVPNGGIV